MFNFIKKSLHSIYNSFTTKINTLFAQSSLDEATLNELEKLLISADTGFATTQSIMSTIKKAFTQKQIHEGKELKTILEQELLKKLTPYETPQAEKIVYLLVGINGSGKTTFAGRFAAQQLLQGKKPLLVAGDTFRAAASAQLNQWAQKSNIDIVLGKENQDPGSVIFNACQQFSTSDYNVLIIDTAGRLQTKSNLMQELAKIKRIIERQLPNYPLITLLTIDAMLGQNSFEQARLFHECTTINGIVLTKMDGTGKGGIVFAINESLKIPVAYISSGEGIEAISLFDPISYVHNLLTT